MTQEELEMIAALEKELEDIKEDLNLIEQFVPMFCIQRISRNDIGSYHKHVLSRSGQDAFRFMIKIYTRQLTEEKERIEKALEYSEAPHELLRIAKEKNLIGTSKVNAFLLRLERLIHRKQKDQQL